MHVQLVLVEEAYSTQTYHIVGRISDQPQIGIPQDCRTMLYETTTTASTENIPQIR